MAWESSGTVSVTKNSTTVTGSSTKFKDNARAGDGFLGPDGVIYEVVNIVSNTSLTISPAYSGSTTSGKGYKIVPIRGYSKKLADLIREEVQPLSGLESSLPSWLSPFSKSDAAKALGSSNPAANSIPLSDEEGKIANEWIADSVTLVNGKIPLNQLDASVDESGTLILADGNGKISLLRLDIGDIAGAIVATFSNLVQNILSRTSASQVRGDLGLGTASTRNVGNKDGNVMTVGSFGLGRIGGELEGVNCMGAEYPSSSTGNPLISSSITANVLKLMSSAVRWTEIWTGGHNNFAGRMVVGGTMDEGKTFIWAEMYSDINTTISSGHIMVASPVLHLYSDTIINDKPHYLEIEDVTLNRQSTGSYLLKNCPPLSDDGWYIEQPRDRNGEVYHNVEWDYDEIKEELLIETFERVWDPSIGKFVNGNPIDIAEGRYIALRFKEDPNLYPEEEGE